MSYSKVPSKHKLTHKEHLSRRGNDITTSDIEDAILNLTVTDYYRGLDPSNKGDFEVIFIGVENVGIYFKYGLQIGASEILIFSNHPPEYPIDKPFNI